MPAGKRTTYMSELAQPRPPAWSPDYLLSGGFRAYLNGRHQAHYCHARRSQWISPTSQKADDWLAGRSCPWFRRPTG